MSFLNASFLWFLLPLAFQLFRSQKRGLSQTLRWLVLGLLVISMARPVLPEATTTQKSLVHSVGIALDLSASMRAEDISPTRVKASKEAIENFLEKNKQDQVALIGFTINPLLLSPPTTDHALVKLALENVNSEYILTKGTDLKKLFEKIAMLSDESKKVILFSDGGDEPIGEDLIEFVQEEKIEILAVATATVEGASIKEKDGKLLQDQKGHIVVSKLNEDLERLAHESGGEMVAFESVDGVVNKMLSWLDGKSREEGVEKESHSYFELAFVPLIFALLLFLVASTNLSKKVVILLLLVGINVEAKEILTKDNWGGGSEIKALKAQKGWSFLEGYYLKRAYVLYADGDYKASLAYLFKIENRKVEAELLLAHNYYKLSMYKRAKLVLERIKSRDRALKQQLYYELGNCEYKLEYMAKAKAFYIKALQLGVDADAEHNLKLAIFQEAKHSLKTGAYNPSDAVHSDNKSDDEREELDEVEGKNKKKSSNTSGGTAGGGAKKNKVSTVKVVKSDKKMKNSKRVMASKAYDLINEGYIQEKKPW